MPSVKRKRLIRGKEITFRYCRKPRIVVIMLKESLTLSEAKAISTRDRVTTRKLGM
jgi:hypothetical protein